MLLFYVSYSIKVRLLKQLGKIRLEGWKGGRVQDPLPCHHQSSGAEEWKLNHHIKIHWICQFNKSDVASQ